MALTWFFKSRKAVTALVMVILCVVVAVIGYATEDLDMVKLALVTAAAVGGTLIFAVMREDVATAEASISEEQEQAFLRLLGDALADMGLDATLIAAIRELADAVIVSREEAGEPTSNAVKRELKDSGLVSPTF